MNSLEQHIDVKFYHIHDERANQGTVDFHYVNTDDNAADLLVKALIRERHQKLTELAGLRFT